MLAQPSMIKRPVLDLGGRLLVGFKPEIYARRRSPATAYVRWHDSERAAEDRFQLR